MPITQREYDEMIREEQELELKKKAKAKLEAKLDAKKAKSDTLYKATSFSKAPTLTSQELGAIQKKAYAVALGKKYVELYRQQMEDNPDTFFNPEDPQDKLISEALTQLNLSNTQHKSTHILLTINVKEGVTLETLITKINKMGKKKWLTDYLLAIEQRGETLADLGKGLHFHAIIPRTIEPARTRKELASTFNSVCDTSNVHCMNIRWLTEKQLPKVILYLQGQKKDSSKSLKVQMDLIYRSSKSLPNLLYPSTSTMAQQYLTPTEVP